MVLLTGRLPGRDARDERRDGATHAPQTPVEAHAEHAAVHAPIIAQHAVVERTRIRETPVDSRRRRDGDAAVVQLDLHGGWRESGAGAVGLGLEAEKGAMLIGIL